MNQYFVTGTGTEVGKTTVSCAILSAAVQRGLAASAVKPAESGCRRQADGSLWPADGDALRMAAGGTQELAEVCPFRFEEAVAPGVAASLGSGLRLSQVVDACTQVLGRKDDVCLVEGAGGLLVPLAANALIADLAVVLSLPIIIVGLAGLGTINHTLLTVEVARSRGLEVAGVVLNQARELVSEAAAASNRSEIERYGQVDVLGVFPHCDAVEATALAKAAERHLALDQLFHVER